MQGLSISSSFTFFSLRAIQCRGGNIFFVNIQGLMLFVFFKMLFFLFLFLIVYCFTCERTESALPSDWPNFLATYMCTAFLLANGRKSANEINWTYFLAICAVGMNLNMKCIDKVANSK